MKIVMSIIILALLTATGNIYAQTYYAGDGGRSITIAVLVFCNIQIAECKFT
jgi:hypothetical protein